MHQNIIQQINCMNNFCFYMRRSDNKKIIMKIINLIMFKNKNDKIFKKKKGIKYKLQKIFKIEMQLKIIK
jgi:hypothetical protein